MVSRRSFMAGVSAACLAFWHRLYAAIAGSLALDNDEKKFLL